jgi:hypothetical protein
MEDPTDGTFALSLIREIFQGTLVHRDFTEYLCKSVSPISIDRTWKAFIACFSCSIVHPRKHGVNNKIAERTLAFRKDPLIHLGASNKGPLFGVLRVIYSDALQRKYLKMLKDFAIAKLNTIGLSRNDRYQLWLCLLREFVALSLVYKNKQYEWEDEARLIYIHTPPDMCPLPIDTTSTGREYVHIALPPNCIVHNYKRPLEIA